MVMLMGMDMLLRKERFLLDALSVSGMMSGRVYRLRGSRIRGFHLGTSKCFLSQLKSESLVRSLLKNMLESLTAMTFKAIRKTLQGKAEAWKFQTFNLNSSHST